VQVAAGETRTLYVKYKDEDGNRIGGKDVTVSGTEFAEGNASVTVEPKANGAELKLVNSGAGDAVMTACQVKGRKITDFGQMDAKSIDPDSIIDYGRRSMKVNLPSVDNLAAAQSIADFEQLRRKDPRGAVSSVTMLSHGQRGGSNHANQLALTIGDLITIQETQTDHDAAYAIIGEAHELTNGASLFKTTWYLEPVPEQYPGKIGTPTEVSWARPPTSPTNDKVIATPEVHEVPADGCGNLVFFNRRVTRFIGRNNQWQITIMA
jgi:hypothetical protein